MTASYCLMGDPSTHGARRRRCCSGRSDGGAGLLAAADDQAALAPFRSHAGTGRPLGDAEKMAGIVRGTSRKRLRDTDLIPPRDVRSLHAGEPI